MATNAAPAKEEPAAATRHCLDDAPYRMLVFAKLSPHNTPLYWIAGSTSGPIRADKALKEAHKLHGGNCFYCKQTVTPEQFTIDHADPKSAGGGGDLQNLLIACKPCNAKKNSLPIEFYRPDAGREWLSAVLRQVEDRLKRLA